MATRRGRGSKGGIVVAGGADARRARETLGLRSVGSHAPIAMLMKKLAGDKDRFMEFAKLAVHIEPNLAPIIESYYELDARLRKVVSIDAICAQHEIDPIHFIGVVGEAAMKF